MKFTTGLLSLAVAGLASSKAVLRTPETDSPGRSESKSVDPTPSLRERSTQTCDQWGTIQTGTYIIYNDLWGESAATSGSQCTTVTGLTNNIVSWNTAWSWAGGSSSVKSYSNVALSFTPTTLADISTLTAVWKWSYSGSSLVADVAFDTFLSSSCSSTTDEYEIMIWLAALGGAGPISSTGSTIATPSIAGYTWSLYYGLNGSTKVYSFVAPSQITSFDANMMLFYNYLISSQGVSSSSCLITFEAGTEPFTGTSAVLSSNYYATIS